MNVGNRLSHLEKVAVTISHTSESLMEYSMFHRPVDKLNFIEGSMLKGLTKARTACRRKVDGYRSVYF